MATAEHAKPKKATTSKEMEAAETNQKILQEVKKLYNKNGNPHRSIAQVFILSGLMELFNKLGTPCQRPREMVTVMIIGNHSAGKSSFINWFETLTWWTSDSH